MKLLSLILLACIAAAPAHAEDARARLAAIQKQRLMVQQAKQALETELGEVGKSLKKLDMALLKARAALHQVQQDIKDTDDKLRSLAKEKKALQQSIARLEAQMIDEAIAAYQQAGSKSIWVDLLTGTSITEIPHRQYLLKYAMLSQEQHRRRWRETVEKITRIQSQEQANKKRLQALAKQRKDAEQQVVQKLRAKRQAAKKLRAGIAQKKAQDIRLARQEKALQRLLSGLGDTLLASDKQGKATSIRKQKGKLPWPLDGHIMVGFKHKTNTGRRISGVQIAPRRRNEQGRLVRALGQGQVRYADWFGGYGLMMIVDYGHGIMAVYAHNDALYKQLGDWVEEGEALALAGSTGWIEDVRLYFEIRDKGKPVNPARWCKK